MYNKYKWVDMIYRSQFQSEKSFTVTRREGIFYYFFQVFLTVEWSLFCDRHLIFSFVIFQEYYGRAIGK